MRWEGGGYVEAVNLLAVPVARVERSETGAALEHSQVLLSTKAVPGLSGAQSGLQASSFTAL
jgi:hypothetical protein